MSVTPKPPYRYGDTYTHSELDAHVRSLFSVGGLYEMIANLVELQERPRCSGEPTGQVMPWRV